MPWKEGVTEEDVKRFHKFIEACNALENQVYDGTLTPQEAKDTVLKYAETLSHPPVNKPGEPPKPDQLPEFPPPEVPSTLPVPPEGAAPKKKDSLTQDERDELDTLEALSEEDSRRTNAPKKR